MKKSLLIMLSVCAAPAFSGPVDSRQAINLSEIQRHYMLTEMRALLTGTQHIMSALAQNDMAAVANYAKPLGIGMVHKAENPLHNTLPMPFMQLGMSLHEDFDRIAHDAATLKDSKYTLRQLSTAMDKCASCHSSYQISITPQTAAPIAASEERLDEVMQRGIHVMPFDLEQTTHVFTKTPQGGVQQVVAKDKSNDGQINLIRSHLSKIAQEFSQGDFSNPAKIHGDGMPGLAVLRHADNYQLNIAYKDLPDGGQVDYSSNKPELIEALHQYFDAQLSDHARHAVSGHDHHMMHPQ